MLFPTLFMPITLTALFAVHDVYPSPLMSRQTLDCSPGGVAQPAADTSVSDGDIIPFDFVEGFTNQCHSPYTPISVWLLAAQPTSSSLNANHEFVDFLFHFGDYTINHFPVSLPLMGTPPPSNLSVPDRVEFRGRDVYIAVVQTVEDCPPEGHTDWCFSSNVLHYITN